MSFLRCRYAGKREGEDGGVRLRNYHYSVTEFEISPL
jgi:hypothetical protein